MNTSSQEKNLSNIFRPIITAAALGVIIAGCSPSEMAMDDDDHDMMSSSSAMMMSSSSMDAMMKSSDAMMSSESSMMKETSMYKDGTYSAGGVYRSPAGGESVQISLTLKDDVVTDATFSGDATHQKSIAMQEAFGSGFKEQVVGKSLDEVSVGVVNGSSLTGTGFMDAVAKIKLEAKAS